MPRLLLRATVGLVLVLLLPAPWASADILTGLIGYWAMNETSGTNAPDTSPVGTSPGTLTGGASFGAGAPNLGNGVVLNGTTGYVELGTPAGLTLTTNVSMCGWVKATAITTAQFFFMFPADQFAGGERIALFVNVSNWRWSVSTTVGNVFIQSAATAGVWTHLCGTYDGANMRLYVNGALAAGPTAQTGGLTPYVNGTQKIGRHSPEYGFFFGGTLDEMRIYNRALTAGDVTELFAFTEAVVGARRRPIAFH